MMEDVQLLSIIGSGAYAVVYKGVYQGGDAAIKLATIDPDKSGWSEAFVACQLRHPHVVSTYTARGARLSQQFFDRVWAAAAPPRPPSPPRDALPALPSEDGLGSPRKITHDQQGWKAVLSRVGASPNKGLLMLVQEFCDKGNLARAIKNGLFRTAAKNPRAEVLARRTLLRTATEICRGMVHLHRASVVHGDLKPANVLLHSSSADRRGFTAKIADFGLARLLHQDVAAIQSETSGTLPYMSPEAFNGVHSKAGDVYAFGVVLYEMLTGAPPYDSVTPGRIMMGVSFQGLRPAWPVSQWPELCALGARCLSQDASQRPSFRQLEGELVALEEAVREGGRGESGEAPQAKSGGLVAAEEEASAAAAAAVEDGAPSAAAAAAVAAQALGGAVQPVGGGSRSASPARARHRLAVTDGVGGSGAAGNSGVSAPASAQRSEAVTVAAAAAGAGPSSSPGAAGGDGDGDVNSAVRATDGGTAATGAASGAKASDAAATTAVPEAVAAAAALSAAIAMPYFSEGEPISPWATALATHHAAELEEPAAAEGEREP